MIFVKLKRKFSQMRKYTKIVVRNKEMKLNIFLKF